jgi:cytochrome c oxidase assembly protein subunit 19
MSEYLSCLKRARGMNDQCRGVAKSYLKCRMENNLMAPDEMRNLGFMEETAATELANGKADSQSTPVRSKEG